MRTSLYIGCFAIVSLLAMGCLDPIEFSSDDSESLLVIDGQFTTDNKTHYLRISRSLPFGEKFFDGVTGASVRLISRELTENYLEIEEGIYRLEGNSIQGRSGDSYYIEVDLPDGEKYRSVEEFMPLKQISDSAHFKFEKEIFVQPNGIDRLFTILNIYVNSPLDGPGLHLRWFVDELYTFPEESCGGLDIPFTCYIPVGGNAQNISLYSNSMLNLDRIEDLKVASKTTFPGEEFKGVHYFNVYQHSITPEAFEYWEKVVGVVSQEGTVFDKTPARIPGNIRNINRPEERVLGYFELTAIDTVRTKVLPHEYQDALLRSPHCSTFFRNNWGPECCNCLRIDNATLEKPDWLK